jgi:hypothetical protein
MAAARSLALPLAVVVGSVILGLSIYFGLREGLRPAPSVAPAASTPLATPASPASPTAATPRYVREPAEPAPARALRQAQAALDALRPGLVKACWTPPGPGEPASILLTYDVTFDAAGQVIAIGVSEHREAYRPAVAACVRAQPRPALPIDPPGQSVRVDLALPMP